MTTYLEHGCTIGPQLRHLAANLLSVFQQLNIIDTALERSAQLDVLLSASLENCCTSGLRLVLKQWRLACDIPLVYTYKPQC